MPSVQQTLTRLVFLGSILCYVGITAKLHSEKQQNPARFVGPRQESTTRFTLDNLEKDVGSWRENRVFHPRPIDSFSFLPTLSSGGIYPGLSATADSSPHRSECGIGALMPWADRLYMVSYLSVPGAGAGTGLYEIYPNFTMNRLASHASTFANRMLHPQSNQVIIGAWTITAAGVVRDFPDLLNVRVAATAEHLTDPERKVYMLGMDGPLWECDVWRRSCAQLFDLVNELNITRPGEQPHFKAAHTMSGRLVVACNTFEEADFVRNTTGGRLAEWRGPGSDWVILERTAFVEVTGRHNFGKVIYAVGWDDRSAILKTFDGGDESAPSSAQLWRTYRLPKASHAYDHLWQTEWPRIREVETERYLMDAHGQFYELSSLGWAGSTFGLRPISQHLRVIPDFTSYRGYLVLGGNQVSSKFDNNYITGQSQSGLWFGKTDDLWGFGKPGGWGGVWRRDDVTAEEPSDPYLMTGFDKKVLNVHLHYVNTTGESGSGSGIPYGPQDPGLGAGQDDEPEVYAGVTQISIQVDFTGTAGHIPGEEWVTMETLTLEFTKNPYVYYTFPAGFSAHWVRLVSDRDCSITAYFHYT